MRILQFSSAPVNETKLALTLNILNNKIRFLIIIMEVLKKHILKKHDLKFFGPVFYLK